MFIVPWLFAVIYSKSLLSLSAPNGRSLTCDGLEKSDPSNIFGAAVLMGSSCLLLPFQCEMSKRSTTDLVPISNSNPLLRVLGVRSAKSVTMRDSCLVGPDFDPQTTLAHSVHGSRGEPAL